MSATRKAIRTRHPMHLGAVATALKAAERTRGWNARQRASIRRPESAQAADRLPRHPQAQGDGG